MPNLMNLIKIFSIFSFCLFLISLPIFGELELVGPLTKEEILENLPAWQEVVASYTVKPDIVPKLSAIDKEINIEIFLGTWCPDSREHVSAYFKIMELVESPFIHTSYIGIPRDKEARQKFIQGKNIIKVPTFIIYHQNKEKGRIIEIPSKSVEEDLLDIIEH